ncbi:hypothetical protein [Hymenobacter sp. BT730]|uniref:hypothetical protein n=1 Tax=Hymenobacter sp. BT730 TaxID=3063332 RepID=UPI0026DF4336|nr:hypothetical protein [Hymenobacter sp. BT730]
MSLRSIILGLLVLASTPVAVLAQNAPRQLNTLPSLPDSARQREQNKQPTQTATPAGAQTPQSGGLTTLPPVETTRFRVGLKSGQELRALDVEVKEPFLGKSYLLLDGQQRLELSQIRYYEDESGFYVRTNLPGSARETTLRRDRAGRISLYSMTRTQYVNNGYSPYGYGRGGYGYPYGFGGGGYRTTKTEYFSKDNGPVQDLNLRNLSVATRDNAGAQSMLNEARRYRTVTTLSYLGAGALTVAGLVSSFNGGSRSISPLIYAAPVLLIVPLVFQGKQQQNIKQAINLYNAQATR